MNLKSGTTRILKAAKTHRSLLKKKKFPETRTNLAATVRMVRKTQGRRAGIRYHANAIKATHHKVSKRLTLIPRKRFGF